MQNHPESSPTPTNKSEIAALEALIAELGGADGVLREKARLMLIARGPAAVPSLIEALRDPRQHLRWEAAKALAGLAAPTAAPSLISALEDRDEDVRWVAAEALAAIGHPAVSPLLKALIDDPKSQWLRDGAHHVFHEYSDREPALAGEMLAALDAEEPAIEVPRVAYRILQSLSAS